MIGFPRRLKPVHDGSRLLEVLEPKAVLFLEVLGPKAANKTLDLVDIKKMKVKLISWSA